LNRIIFIILLLVNTLFSNTLNEVDLKVLKDLNIEPSFLSNRTLQNTFDEYSSGYNISYYNNFIKKSSLNAQIVKSEIENENLPDAVFFIPMIESHFVNQTRGRNSPAGLWQIIPQTATSLKLRNDEFIDERLDLIKSTDAASSYLKRYYGKLGKWYLALIAYNCGEGRVIEGVARASLDKYLELNPNMADSVNIRSYKRTLEEYKRTKSGLKDLYEIYNRLGKQQGSYSFDYLINNNKNKSYLPETSVLYLNKLIAFSMISNRNLFRSMNNKSKYKLEKVKANKGLQLISIANAIGMNYDEFRSINKHIKKDVIPSDSKSYNIYIPSEKLDIYNQRMSGIKPVVTTNIKDTKKEEKVVKENKQIKDNKKVKEIDKNKKNIDNKKDINKPIIYIVKKGDSFESIAKKYKINVKKLKADNKKKSNLIDVGDKIEIYR
jgi:membrane-bound lytic murein transglycosylase D